MSKELYEQCFEAREVSKLICFRTEIFARSQLSVVNSALQAVVV